MDYSQAVGLARRAAQYRAKRAGSSARRQRAWSLPRSYLGASIIGHECDRQVQFDWWCGRLLPARVKSIFRRGHFFEALVREQFVAAEFVFAPVEAWEFTALDGYFQGHADGILIAGPPSARSLSPAPLCLGVQGAQREKLARGLARRADESLSALRRQVALYQLFSTKPIRRSSPVSTPTPAKHCTSLCPSTPSAPSRRSTAPPRSSPRPGPANCCRGSRPIPTIGAAVYAPTRRGAGSDERHPSA